MKPALDRVGMFDEAFTEPRRFLTKGVILNRGDS